MYFFKKIQKELFFSWKKKEKKITDSSLWSNLTILTGITDWMRGEINPIAPSFEQVFTKAAPPSVAFEFYQL